MKIKGTHYTTLWETDSIPSSISVIDQRLLPFKFEIVQLRELSDFANSIKEMYIRGAPLIGITTLYGLYFAVKNATSENEFYEKFDTAKEILLSTRPTAVNLNNSVQKVENIIYSLSQQKTHLKEKINSLLKLARIMRENDINQCKQIGKFGYELIKQFFIKKKDTVNILTHCNAGWLATIDFGTALSPIYFAHQEGIPIHVWVDETRPRNQGAKLTSFELFNEGIPHTLIADNTGGLLMQKGLVDLVIVGSDRTTINGDVVNKIGTYLKALAAKDNNVPFYVAVPSSSIDWKCEDSRNDIEIEIRSEEEVKYISGLFNGQVIDVLICPEEAKALNFAFDITPANLVTALITERGICQPNQTSILELFPEQKK